MTISQSKQEGITVYNTFHSMTYYQGGTLRRKVVLRVFTVNWHEQGMTLVTWRYCFTLRISTRVLFCPNANELLTCVSPKLYRQIGARPTVSISLKKQASTYHMSVYTQNTEISRITRCVI